MNFLPQSDKDKNDIDLLYDIVFIINVNSKGWILEKICKVIAEQSGLQTRIITTEQNNKITGWLPPARAYFFSHFKLLLGSIGSPAFPDTCRKFVWFTHPDFPSDKGRDELVVALNQAAKVFTANSFHKRALEFMGVRTENIVTIIGGADPNQFVKRERSGKTVGFVGAYYERKNPDLMLASIEAMPDVKFSLLAPHHSEVENRSLLWENWPRFAELLALPNFEFISARFEDFAKHFATFDVYLSLSRLEGGPIPLLEAMFSNLYPVATRTGFCEDLITPGKNGILLPVSPSLEEVVAAVRAALADQSTDIATTVADYSWSGFGSQFREAIDPVLPDRLPTVFSDEEARLAYLRDGWGSFEGAGVWLAMSSGSLRIRVGSDVNALVFGFEAEPAFAMNSVSVGFLVNGIHSANGTFAPGSHKFEINLPTRDVQEALVVDIQMLGEQLEDLGTICLDWIGPLSREAARPLAINGVIPALDNSKTGPNSNRPSTFELPVTIVSRPKSDRSETLLRQVSGRDVRIVSLQECGPDMKQDGIFLAHGWPSASQHTGLRFDGYILDQGVELPNDSILAEENVLVLPEIVRVRSPSHLWSPGEKVAHALFIGEFDEQERRSHAWIRNALEDLEVSVGSTADISSLAKRGSSSFASQESAPGLDADLCLFAGRQSELPAIAACLGLGIPVLLFGPTPLLSSLEASDLRYLFIHSESRLKKTIGMLSKTPSKVKAVERLKDCLENYSGLQGAKNTVSRFISGLIAKKVLKAMDARIGLITSDNDEVATSKVSDLILAAGASPVLLSPSEVPRALAAQTSSVPDKKIDAVLCLAGEASGICRGVSNGVVPVIDVETGDWAECKQIGPAGYERHSKIMLPWALASCDSHDGNSPLSRRRDEARKTLKVAEDELVILCIGPTPESEQELAAFAELSRVLHTVPSRLIFPACDKKADRPVNAAWAAACALLISGHHDKAEIAFQAADAALILAQPSDANFIAKCFSHGLPALVRCDAPEAAYIVSGANGASFDPTDPKSLSKAIKPLLEGRGARSVLSKQALATAQSLPTSAELSHSFAAQLLNGIRQGQGS